MSRVVARQSRYAVVEGRVDGRPSLTLVSVASELRATFVPSLAMLGTSLKLGDDELLGQRSGVRGYAEHAKTMGIPLLYPWANRLEPASVGQPPHVLKRPSPLIHPDQNGLPIHGLHLVDAGWDVTERFADDHGARLSARLRFDRDDLLAQFPFPHEIAVTVSLRGSTIQLDTKVRPTGVQAVPISFGWHPYFHLPRAARRDWEIGLPVTSRAVLDDRMLPTGRFATTNPELAPLGDRTFDDLFTGLSDPGVFTLSSSDARVEVAFGDGYPWAQVYAPNNDDVIAFEPMTAPTSALATGNQLPIVDAGETFTATFSITAMRR